MLILAPAEVASINVNGTVAHSAFSVPCRGTLFTSDSNTLAAFRNKYAKVELFILDKISMVSKKCFHQMHHCLIEIFNFPNFSFSVR